MSAKNWCHLLQSFSLVLDWWVSLRLYPLLTPSMSWRIENKWTGSSFPRKLDSWNYFTRGTEIYSKTSLFQKHWYLDRGAAPTLGVPTTPQSDITFGNNIANANAVAQLIILQMWSDHVIIYKRWHTQFLWKSCFLQEEKNVSNWNTKGIFIKLIDLYILTFLRAYAIFHCLFMKRNRYVLISMIMR